MARTGTCVLGLSAGRLKRRAVTGVVALLGGALAVPVIAAPASASTPAPAVDRIVYVSSGEIHTADHTGSDVKRLTANTANDDQPSWSPDGTKVAFRSDRDGSTDVWVMDADGTDPVKVTSSGPWGGYEGDPDWSPDGSRLVFVAGADPQDTDLWTVAPDGSGASALSTDGLATDSGPSWSPDGQRIVFSRYDGTLSKVHTVPAAGGSTTALVPGVQPSWSPDGTRIAFRGTVTPLMGLATMAADGSGATLLPPGAQTSAIMPTWSRDAERLYAVGSSQLVVVDIASGASAPVTAGFQPDFSHTPPPGGGEVSLPGGATGSTSSGQQLTVQIDAPTDGTRSAAGLPRTVTGTVSLDAVSDRPYHAAYVVDASGSTTATTNRDCNGDGTVSTADNFNSDGTTGDILDCEIASVLALNHQVAGLGQAQAGVVALGGVSTANLNDPMTGAAGDMEPASGIQLRTPAGATTGAGARHVDTVLRSLRVTSLRQFTPLSFGNLTHYDAALRRMNDQLVPLPADQPRVAYFLSDGLPTSGSLNLTATGQLARAAFWGVRVFTFGVGAESGGCVAGQPLRTVADRTGGTCTTFSNPEALAAAIAQPATLSGLTVSIDGTSVAATLDATSTPPTWTAQLPAGFPAGTHALRATAAASDGSTVTASVQVTGIVAPVVDAGGPYTVEEGSTVALAGTVSDADSGTVPASWSPATRLDDATSPTATYAGDDDRVDVLTLSASDSDGLTDSATATVTTLNAPPRLGTVTAPASGVTGERVDLSVPFTDPGALDSHTATVDWGDGTSGPATVTDTTTGGELTAAHTYSSGGQYTITITVADDDSGQDTTQVGPFRVNTTPEADAGDATYIVDEGASLTLAGTASDADGDPLTVAWTPSTRLSAADTLTPAYDTRDESTDTLTLSVSDGELTDADQTTVVVENAAPTLGDVSGPSGVVPPGTQVSVSVPFTEPGELDEVTGTVDWGDGTSGPVTVSRTATGGTVSATHTYSGAGTFTVTLSVDDGDGGTDSAQTTITTNRPPSVDAGPPLTLTEGELGQLQVTASDPDGDALTYRWTPTSGLVDDGVEDPQVEGVDDGVQTYSVTVTDPHGATAADTVQVTVTNAPPALPELSAPTAPQPVGASVPLSGSYTDAGVLDTHVVDVDWGDGTSSAGSASDGSLSASHAYATPGVYTVTATVTDDDGGATSRAFQYVVVYDPAAGSVTGGGHVDSPAGAYRPDPTLTGKATFGFVSRYEKGKTVPTGKTQFQFRAGRLDFSSTSYEWLVVSGTRATYRGTGTVNGAGQYAFTLSAVDGHRSGGDGVDRLRMRIWEQATGSLVYDNQHEAAEDAVPTTALAGGSIVIHS